MIKAGTFSDKSGSGGNNTTTAKTSGRGKPTKQKRDTINAVVEEEDNRERKKTEVKENKMPT